MRKMASSPIEAHIAKFLFHQHLTPHTSTRNSPAELLMGRRPRSLLDVVLPDLSTTVRQQQERQKLQHDRHIKVRKFSEGDSVFMRNFSPQHPHLTWIPGQILITRGPVSYTVQLSDDRIVHQHVDHICRSVTSPSSR